MKIEKLNTYADWIWVKQISWGADMLRDKINQIIDVVNLHQWAFELLNNAAWERLKSLLPHTEGDDTTK